jgi:hypothetical protein
MVYPKKSVISKNPLYLLSLVPVLALASPAFAGNDTPPTTSLADHAEPGSVIVWPKFQTGSVNVNPGTAGAFVAPKTLIELGAVCPADMNGCGGKDNTVTVHLQWICPGVAEFEQPSVCPATDFFVNLTYGPNNAQKITFNPFAMNGPSPSDYNGNTQVPTAPCPKGYLIGWAVDSTTGAPIVFNGLVGDSIQRNMGPDLQQETAITIQGIGSELSSINLVNGGLPFDGQSGHYAAVTGQVTGDVSFDSDVNAPFHNEALIFLNLDVKAGQENNPVYVPLDFYNYNELQFSTDWEFTCWGQVELSQGLDPFLTTEGMGSYGGSTRHDKGLVISGQAFDAILGQSVPRTLLGVIQTTEGPGPWNATTSYDTPYFNNSVPVTTTFYPN